MSYRAVGRRQPSTFKELGGRDLTWRTSSQRNMWPRCGACLPPMPLSVSALCALATGRAPLPSSPRKTAQFQSRKWPQCPVLPGTVDGSSCCSWRRAPGRAAVCSWRLSHGWPRPAPSPAPMHDPLGSGHLSLSAMAPGPRLLAVPLYRRWDQRAERGKPWEVSYIPAWFSGGQWLAQVHTGMKGVVTSRAQFF